jgi:hypothetical protein
MHFSLTRTTAVGTVVLATMAVAACGGGSGGSSSASNANGNGSTVSLSPTDFTSDFSALAKLKDLAKQGKGRSPCCCPTRSRRRVTSRSTLRT